MERRLDNPGRRTGPTRGRRGRWLCGRARRRLVSLGLVLFLLPHLYVVAFGREWYPLTCAAMFAYHVDDDTPRYAFYLTGEFPDGGVPRPMRFSDARANARNFFGHVYGSASPATTHDYFPDDNPERFAGRLSAWFTGYLNTWVALHPDEAPPSSITLWLGRVYPELTEPTAVMRFDTAGGAVEVRPEAAWRPEAWAAGEQGGPR